MSPGVSTDIAHFFEERIRAADAKEVGVGNPAEETYRYPNQSFLLPTLSIGPQMSIHKGRHKISNAFLEVGLCMLTGCSFCVAWEAGDEAGAAFVGQIGVKPVEENGDFVAQANEKDEVNEEPREPGGVAGEFEMANFSHGSGAADGGHGAFVP